jgi:hypothetical protein
MVCLVYLFLFLKELLIKEDYLSNLLHGNDE